MVRKIGFIGGRGIHSNYGGVENAIREISFAISAKIVTVVVYGSKTESDTLFELPSNVVEISAPVWVYRNFGQFGLTFFNVLHAITVSRPPIIVVFASGPAIFTPLLRLAGLKVITSLRAVDSNREKWGVFSKKILQIGEWFAWKFSNIFTVNSKEMLNHYSVKRADVRFIPNGCRAIIGAQNALIESIGNSSYFLFAARLDPVKRLHLLLQAYSEIKQPNKPKLIVAGGHVKDANYELKLRKFESENVIFVGHVEQSVLETLIQRCEAFILPSVLEGMSNGLLSAMVNGKAVLVADIPANSDVVANDKAIFKADDIDSLKTGLIRLMENQQFRDELGALLKNRALANYSWESTANAFYAAAKDVDIEQCN